MGKALNFAHFYYHPILHYKLCIASGAAQLCIMNYELSCIEPGAARLCIVHYALCIIKSVPALGADFELGVVAGYHVGAKFGFSDAAYKACCLHLLHFLVLGERHGK